MRVRRIIEHSVVDGPGNRIAIFLQGCNIRCAYCHNPETQALDDSEAVDMTIEDILGRIRKCVPFVRGITLSGGECMLQVEEMTALFHECKKMGLSCLIDSNGTIDFSHHQELLRVADGVMLDVKAWDKDVFKHLTGADNAVVKHNLKYLSDRDKIYEIRIVCIDEVDVDRTIRNVAVTLSDKVSATRLKLIRFRNNGVVGRLANKPSPTDENMQRWKELATQCGFEKIEIS